MGKILNKNEIRELLYAEYLKNDLRILTPIEIENRTTTARSTLKRIYGKLDVDMIWQDIARTYSCKIPTALEQSKMDLIKRLQEVAKVEGEPVNSKLHRDLYCKGCRLFGSWRELNMSAGIQVESFKTQTINSTRKDEILEKLMLIACLNDDMRFKTRIQRYKNMPSFGTVEKLCNNKWKDIVDILHFDLRDVNKYRYINNKEMLIGISKALKEKKLKSLFKYSFSGYEDKIQFIYVINKVGINWEWLNVLIKNKFVDCKSQKFKYAKTELLNILAFKYVLFKRHLSSTEINNDPFLPNAMEIMKVFGKNIYEVWAEIEKNNKYKL